VPTAARIGNENQFEVHPYGFGERRFPPLALLTLIEFSEWRSCGVVITKFSGHVVALPSSPAVFADTPMSWSTSTRIVAGKPPSAAWSAAMLLGLYRIWAPSWGTRLLTATKERGRDHGTLPGVALLRPFKAKPPSMSDRRAYWAQSVKRVAHPGLASLRRNKAIALCFHCLLRVKMSRATHFVGTADLPQ
jgi:hypothetical protein